MADQIATRYGILGRELSRAVVDTIVLAAHDGVASLDRVHARLGSASGGPPSPETSKQRFEKLLRTMFPTSTILVELTRLEPRDHPTATSTDADERIVRKLLTTVASFLLAESTRLEDSINYCQTVVGVPETDLVELEDLLMHASVCAGTLLDHAETGRWRALLEACLPRPVQASSPRLVGPAVPRVPQPAAAAVLARPVRDVVRVGLVVGHVASGKTATFVELTHALTYALRSLLDQRGLPTRAPVIELFAPVHTRAALALWLREASVGSLRVRPHFVSVDDDGELKSAAAGRRPADERTRHVSSLATQITAVAQEAQRLPGIDGGLDQLIVYDGGTPVLARPRLRRRALEAQLPSVELPDLRGCQVLLTGSIRTPSWWWSYWHATFADDNQIDSVDLFDTSEAEPLAPSYTARREALYTAVLTDWASTRRAMALIAAILTGAFAGIVVLSYASISLSIVVAFTVLAAVHMISRTITERVPRARAPLRTHACSSTSVRVEELV